MQEVTASLAAVAAAAAKKMFSQLHGNFHTLQAVFFPSRGGFELLG